MPIVKVIQCTKRDLSNQANKVLLQQMQCHVRDSFVRKNSLYSIMEAMSVIEYITKALLLLCVINQGCISLSGLLLQQ